MRQIGMLAAAGLYALARQLVGIEGLGVYDNKAKTNMVYLSTTESDGAALQQWCAAKGLLLAAASRRVWWCISRLMLSRLIVQRS